MPRPSRKLTLARVTISIARRTTWASWLFHRVKFLARTELQPLWQDALDVLFLGLRLVHRGVAAAVVVILRPRDRPTGETARIDREVVAHNLRQSGLVTREATLYERLFHGDAHDPTAGGAHGDRRRRPELLRGS